MTNISTPIIYVISDAAGETGEAVVKAAIAQFHPRTVEVRRIPYIESKHHIDKVIEKAKLHEAFIVFTLVIPELRDYLIEQARKGQVNCIDVLGPVLNQLELRIGESRHQPGKIHELNEDYFKKVEAVEFAVKYDDGKDPRGIILADIVLVGVSRTSKTPLSMYLAHKKYKVANVPLVPEIKPPEELFQISKHKIIGLHINTLVLNRIRIERLKSLGLASDAAYAKLERIEKELHYSQSWMDQLDCHVIDVSNKAVEETASIIMEMYEN